jgi:hypothetical protein
MITVLQCAHCKNIVGDTDVLIPAGAESLEIKHPFGIDAGRNGRIRCGGCSEYIGNEDGEGKFFYTAKAVTKYAVRSSVSGAADAGSISQVSKKKRKGEDEEGDFVSVKEFEAFRLQYMKEMADVKELLVQMFEQQQGR